MVICGTREETSKTVTIRKHGGEDLGSMTIQELVKVIS
jgi:threonyl-tRNA synthetase